MAEEKKKTTTKKPSTSTTKKSTTTTKKKTQASTTKKSSTSSTKKAPSKSASTTTKKTTKTTSKPKTENKPKNTKTTSKSVKNDKKSSNLTSPEVKTTQKPKTTSTKKTSTATKKTHKKRTTGRVKKTEELTTLEVLESAVEGKEITEKKPLGKTFYLIFSILLFGLIFVYIFFEVNDGIASKAFESAIFAFAAVFIFFVLLLFNVPKIIVGFFYLPFRRLVKQARRERNQEIIFSMGKNKIQTTFNKYRSWFTLFIYFVLAAFFTYATIAESIQDNDTILQTIYSTSITLLIFLVVVCSWQYLFNILPSILEKSIDAKNGYVLSLSAIVMIMYIIFLYLDINFLAEVMIFVLIIGFVALLGVNLNMIVGEINIFQNLRNRKSKAVTRVVFSIFFAFHIYVIIYASVVAYSIYNWEPEAFVFSSNPSETVLVEDVYNDGFLVSNVYQAVWNDTNSENDYILLDAIYDVNRNEITVYHQDNITPSVIYNSDGEIIHSFFTSSGDELNELTDKSGKACDMGTIFFNAGTLSCFQTESIPHEYGDFLYWTVVTVSTIGYGDIHPSTEYNIAMGWGAFLGMYGLTFFALSISFVSNIAMEGVQSNRAKREEQE